VTYALIVLVVMWVAVTAYALLGGADFGAGIWDLLAGGRTAGAPRRALIEHSIGPVWEANHVWLIYVLVLMWTAFPTAFAAVASTLYLPLTFVALGVIARGSAFAFRKAIDQPWARRLFGAAFAGSSVVTPWFLGAAAGAVASGRVPPGLARGNAITSWLNPVSAVTGTFAVAACAFLAASYLTREASRAGDPALAGYFRRRALASGLVVGACSAAGLAVLHAEAPVLFGRLTGGRVLPLVVAAGLAGTASLALAWPGSRAAPSKGKAAVRPGVSLPGASRPGASRLSVVRLAALRVCAAGAVAAVLWAWGAAQYPFLLLPGLTVHAAEAPRAALAAILLCTAVGGALLIPSLAWLFILFQRQPRTAVRPGGQGSPRRNA
jgi:cytochrome d ubiquinol oxidase subunit II